MRYNVINKTYNASAAACVPGKVFILMRLSKLQNL